MSISQDINEREYSKFDNDNRVLVNPDILPTSGNNGSITLSQSDNVVASTQTLTKTIGATSYQKTISKNAAGDVVSVSAWSEV